MDDNDWQAREVAWYIKHGSHVKDRIVKDSQGNPYVIGDASWNTKGRPSEHVETRMAADLHSEASE